MCLSLSTIRNFKRVEFLTKLVEDLSEAKMDAWWNCRNFVLNEDLCLDYDIGGLAVSATFLITVGVFCILASQVLEWDSLPWCGMIWYFLLSRSIHSH